MQNTKKSQADDPRTKIYPDNDLTPTFFEVLKDLVDKNLLDGRMRKQVEKELEEKILVDKVFKIKVALGSKVDVSILMSILDG